MLVSSTKGGLKLLDLKKSGGGCGGGDLAESDRLEEILEGTVVKVKLVGRETPGQVEGGLVPQEGNLDLLDDLPRLDIRERLRAAGALLRGEHLLHRRDVPGADHLDPLDTGDDDLALLRDLEVPDPSFLDGLLDPVEVIAECHRLRQPLLREDDVRLDVLVGRGERKGHHPLILP